MNVNYHQRVVMLKSSSWTSKTLKSLKCKKRFKLFCAFLYTISLEMLVSKDAILNLGDPELQKDLLVYMHRCHYAVHDTLSGCANKVS